MISRNAVGLQVPAGAFSPRWLGGVDVVLVDGHQMDLAAAAVARAEVPVVADAGSWKAGFEAVLPRCSHVLCSADFLPPGCRDEEDVFEYLAGLGVPWAAVTHGAGPVRWRKARGEGGEVAVPAVPVVDTLGAGDVFHGAFCRYVLDLPFPSALARAAAVAARSCGVFGTRAWLTVPEEG